MLNMKIGLCLILSVTMGCCYSQGLTGDDAAFEQLKRDVRSAMDSCLSRAGGNTTNAAPVDCWMKVSLDSNGFIRSATLIRGSASLKDSLVTCIEQSVLSANRQYGVYIEDYHYWKDKYWKLHDDAIYYIGYRRNKSVQ